MAKLKTWTGILILITYLCPFVSCNKEVEVSPAAVKESLVTTGTTDSSSSVKAEKPKNKTKGFGEFLLFPTDNSISGLGEVCSFDDNETARFLLVSFLLSILIVLPLRFSDYKIGRVLIVAVNLACIIAFMYFTAIVEEEILLWGIWLLVALVIIHLILEIMYKKRALITNPKE